MELLAINWTNTMIIVGLGFGIVFVILTFLVIILNIWQKISNKSVKTPKIVAHEKVELLNQAGSNNNIFVAIASTLYLYFEDAHDIESGIITIKKHNTEWNSILCFKNNLNN